MIIPYEQLPDQIKRIFIPKKNVALCRIRHFQGSERYYVKTHVPSETTVFHYVKELGWQHLRSY